MTFSHIFFIIYSRRDPSKHCFPATRTHSLSLSVNTSMASFDYQCSDFNDIAKCFQKLHIHINHEVESLKMKQVEIGKRMDVVENQQEFINGEVQEIHAKHFPDIETKIEREEVERLKLELWGRKWNLIVRVISGNDKDCQK